MSTTKQKKAARENLKKARAAGTTRKEHARSSKGDQLSTSDKNDLPRRTFAFPRERKVPLNDAKHVRNALARFDQVEGVTDKERDKAWKRITKAARTYDVEVEASSWHDLVEGGRTGRSRTSSSSR